VLNYLIFNFLKTKHLLYIRNPYRTVNTLHHRYKNQSFNDVYGPALPLAMPECTDSRLKLYTGASNASCITRFRPVVFPHARMIYKLLLTLHNYHLCCFLTGAFALFVASKLHSYDGIPTFVAMTDPKTTPVLCWLLQHLCAPPPQAFAIDADFAFTLTNADDAHMNMFHYAMSYENVGLSVTFVGIDTVKQCGPLSNVDLVHFVWENFIRFCYKKYAFVLSPRGSDAQPELLFLKHYRLDSDGWKDKARCDSCVESPSDGSDDCACNICTRQLPTLAACAQHVLFNYTLHLRRFRLDVETTHDRYVYAVHSNRVPREKLLPPEAPSIIVSFYYDVDSPFRFDRDCTDSGSWIGRSERSYAFDLPEDIINDLIRHKNHFWCHHCERGIFFPSTCAEHANTELLEEGGGEAGLDEPLEDGDDDDEFAGPFLLLDA